MYFGLQHSKEDQRPNAMQGEARMQSLPGFPSVVQNSPQGYIDQLLAQNGAAAATHPDIFSPLNQQEGHNLSAENGNLAAKKHSFAAKSAGVLVTLAVVKMYLSKKLFGAAKNFWNRSSELIEPKASRLGRLFR